MLYVGNAMDTIYTSLVSPFLQPHLIFLFSFFFFVFFVFLFFFFFNDTATTEIYTLSLHDALPISRIMPIKG